MTPFEQRVAKALQQIFYEWRENPPPEENRNFGDYAAPNVAAAIEAAASWGQGLETGQDWMTRSLAALRGAARSAS